MYVWVSQVTKELNKDTECCTVQPNGNSMLPYSLYFAIKSLTNFKGGQTYDGLVAREHCQVTYCCLERLTRYEHILGSGGMAPHILNLGPYEGVYSFKPRSLYFPIRFIECWAVVQPIWASWLTL